MFAHGPPKVQTIIVVQNNLISWYGDRQIPIIMRRGCARNMFFCHANTRRYVTADNGACMHRLQVTTMAVSVDGPKFEKSPNTLCLRLTQPNVNIAIQVSAWWHICIILEQTQKLAQAKRLCLRIIWRVIFRYAEPMNMCAYKESTVRYHGISKDHEFYVYKRIFVIVRYTANKTSAICCDICTHGKNACIFSEKIFVIPFFVCECLYLVFLFACIIQEHST